MFKSPKEAQRAKEFLEPTSGFIGVDDEWGCWLDWKGAMRLEIGVNAGSSESGVHNFVRREVCRRFDVRRIGADSVGWYPDSDFTHVGEHCAGTNYPGYTSWAVWAKEYKAEWSHELPKEKYWPKDDFKRQYDATMAFLLEVEAYVVGVFKVLDASRDIDMNGGESG